MVAHAVYWPLGLLGKLIQAALIGLGILMAFVFVVDAILWVSLHWQLLLGIAGVVFLIVTCVIAFLWASHELKK